jgi:hypothetical protein
MILAMAALGAAAGTASAQTVKAEIPFAFRVGSQVMRPGAYRIQLRSVGAGTPVLSVANFDVKRTVMLLPANHDVVARDWAAGGVPKLRFTCDEAACTISSIWMGEGDEFHFRTPRGKNGEPHVAEIILRAERAD